MFCRNCSNEVSEGTIACLNCGVPPLKGKNYCNNCNAETHPDAIICVKCGIDLKGTNHTEENKILNEWSRFSYVNYIIIVLISSLPFVNFKCGNEKVYTVSGIDLAVSKEHHYKETKDYGYYGSHDWDRKETIFSIEICAFYIGMIVCVIALLGKHNNRFKYSKRINIAALIVLLEWYISTTIKLSKFDAGNIEASIGIGFWLTLILTILSLVLISTYVKQQDEIERLQMTEYDLLFNKPSWFKRNLFWVIWLAAMIVFGIFIWYTEVVQD